LGSSADAVWLAVGEAVVAIAEAVALGVGVVGSVVRRGGRVVVAVGVGSWVAVGVGGGLGEAVGAGALVPGARVGVVVGVSEGSGEAVKVGLGGTNVGMARVGMAATNSCTVTSNAHIRYRRSAAIARARMARSASEVTSASSRSTANWRSSRSSTLAANVGCSAAGAAWIWSRAAVISTCICHVSMSTQASVVVPRANIVINSFRRSSASARCRLVFWSEGVRKTRTASMLRLMG
jgi:hypothetical protein